jgi:hypothetical protein
MPPTPWLSVWVEVSEPTSAPSRNMRQVLPERLIATWYQVFCARDRVPVVSSKLA